VVGIAGVSGNGQGELLRLLSGEDTRRPVGQMHWFSATAQTAGSNAPTEAVAVNLATLSVAQRRALGLRSVPEERLGRGAVPALGLAHNLLLTRRESVSGPWGWLNLSRLRAQTQTVLTRYGVKADGPDAQARSLSGGNLQKFMVGREVDASPRLFIVSQPTWGVDVGAATQIRQAILSLRDSGCAVLLVSEELEELLALSDRLQVIYKGRLSPSLSREQATVERLGEWMSGLWPRTVAATEAVVTAPLISKPEVCDAAAA
jgi:simple sugar transport system ATP-binding protein